MIQRIQSIFLFCTALVIGLLFFIPFATIPINDTMCDLYTTKIVQTVPQNQFIMWNWPSCILTTCITILAIFTIFVRKKKSKTIRPTLFLQFRLAIINFVLQIGLMIIMCILLFQTFPKEIGFWETLRYSHSSFIFPIVGMIFNWLAIRCILKDIALLKSFDRIR